MLLFLSVFTTLAIAAAAGGNRVLSLTTVGTFLYDRFLQASFYVPLYFLFSGIYLLFDGFSRKVIYIQLSSVIPFVTAAWFCRVIAGDDALKVVYSILIAFFFIAEIYGILVLFFRDRFSFSFGSSREEEDEKYEEELDEWEEKLRENDIFSDMEAESTEAAPEPELPPESYIKMGFEKVPVPEGQADDEPVDISFSEFNSGIGYREEPEQLPEARPVPEPEEDDIVIEIPSDDKPIPMVHRKRRAKYEIPVDEVLEDRSNDQAFDITDETREDAEILLGTLREFKIEAKITGIRKGPVITMFEILPASGVNVSKIAGLADNIALNMAARSVRIVAPIPGKRAVGVEIPNMKRSIVGFKELISRKNPDLDKAAVPFILGRDIEGDAQVIDLARTPHILIAGATGSGKSVCVNALISTILYKKHPDDVKMILIDPKVVELKMYNGVPHLLTPVITDPKKALQALNYCIAEMERRYSLLETIDVRNIEAFNKKIKANRIALEPLPYILVIIDEFADLMLTSGKELEPAVSRLTAKARAVGIHLVLATQRPSVDVITGVIKANIPSRIAFMVASYTDSRVILDSGGAEMLLGKGDMLFKSSWDPNITRIQSAFLSDEEVERLVSEVRKMGEPEYIDDEIFMDDDDLGDSDCYTGSEGDSLFDRALGVVASTGKASASYLQRRLSIGYNRAARLIEEMEARGIIGPANGSKPREILHLPDKFRE